MSISIGSQHRSAQPRHLAAGRFEQASLAILSRYSRLAATADAVGRDPVQSTRAPKPSGKSPALDG